MNLCLAIFGALSVAAFVVLIFYQKHFYPLYIAVGAIGYVQLELVYSDVLFLNGSQ